MTTKTVTLYRLLEPGEVIREGDRWVDDDCFLVTPMYLRGEYIGPLSVFRPHSTAEIEVEGDA